MGKAPDRVLALVEKLARHADAYRRGRYGETNLRVEFIDPLFIAPGSCGSRHAIGSHLSRRGSTPAAQRKALRGMAAACLLGSIAREGSRDGALGHNR
jgi:hypothetical protein